MNTWTYISIGPNCDSAVRRVNKYNRKSPLYKTCPFDLMVTNLEGIIKCFENDFADFCNLDYIAYDDTDVLPGKEILIRHSLYNFIFNHETPGHADLHLKEKWPGKDKFHFTKNNFEMFVQRYNERINNLRNNIDKNKKITFIYYHKKKEDDNHEHLLEELHNILKLKYPKKHFAFDVFAK
jgi:hypothetical protein